MITKNRIIAERLLREFIRGSFGIISEASPEEEFNPAAAGDAAEATLIVDNQKKAHLEDAQEFVNSRVELLEQILDGIEGPLAITGLEQLQSVLTDAMQFDDTYKKEGQTNHNLATTFTCLSLAEGDVHNIPYLMAAFGKAFAVKPITKSRSGTGNYTVAGQIKDTINESGGSAGVRPVAEIIDKEIEKIIPLLFGDRTKLAQDVIKKSERFDFNAPGYVKIEIKDAMLKPGRGNKVSFKDALKSSALETIKIQNVALGKSESHIEAESEAIQNLSQEIYDLNNTLKNLRNNGTDNGKLYDTIVKNLDTKEAQKEAKEQTLPDFIRESDAMLRVLERRLDDETFLLSKIREFANSTLEGWDRTAANYPKMSGAIKTAGSYVGKKTIGAGLAALVYGVYEITPANVMKIDFEYELAQEEAIEYIAQMFEDNDMGNFANTLRSYKS